MAYSQQRLVGGAARQIDVALGRVRADLRFGLEAQGAQGQEVIGELLGFAEDLLGSLFRSATLDYPRSDRQRYFFFG